MSKVAVVYWSGTGNTAAMATAVIEGAKSKEQRSRGNCFWTFRLWSSKGGRI